jgi:hypothetical protein
MGYLKLGIKFEILEDLTTFQLIKKTKLTYNGGIHKESCYEADYVGMINETKDLEDGEYFIRTKICGCSFQSLFFELKNDGNWAKSRNDVNESFVKEVNKIQCEISQSRIMGCYCHNSGIKIIARSCDSYEEFRHIESNFISFTLGSLSVNELEKFRI